MLSRHGLLDELCPPTFADLQTFAKDELPSAADRDLWFVKHKQAQGREDTKQNWASMLQFWKRQKAAKGAAGVLAAKARQKSAQRQLSVDVDGGEHEV